MNTLHPIFHPALKDRTALFNIGGVFNASDVALVRANASLRDALNLNNNSPSSNLFVGCESFDDILPKDVQSTGEFRTYFNNIKVEK